MKKLTIADVAKHANVSKSTVSQYLNRRYEYMSVETKERIEEAIKELDYKPNYLARSLKQKHTSTIGVIVANILHSFSTQIIRAVEDYCHQHAFHIIVCNADDEPEKERNYIEMLRAKQVDGMIIFPTGDNLDTYQKLVNEDFPIVFMDRMVPELAIPSILLDNEMAVNLAMDHFVAKGYERIGIITTSIIHHVTPRVERINGYKQALKKHGLPMNPAYIKSLDLSNIQNGLRDMLDLEHPPQAILAGNDLTMMEILKYVHEHQLIIPEQLGLIGIDDVSFASFYQPTLTTVAQPTYEMGKMAAKLLLKKIKKEELNNESYIYRLKPELIVRESC